MALRSTNRQNKDPSRFSAALSSAFSEWMLIILLLIDAFCLYLVMKIFRSCKLKTPCLLCSRLGYVLGNEKLGCYRDLVCDAHKLELSSLSFCHAHKKLADAREMCETCLLSCAKKMSSLETCKFFISKLNMDVDDGDRINSISDEVVKVPLLKKDHDADSPRPRPCSCCSQSSRNYYTHILPQNKPIFKEFGYPSSPLCSSAGLRARARLPDRLSITKELCMPLTDHQSGGHGFDRLSHFRYKELKIDSESESDDDDGSLKPCRTEDVKEESVVQCLKSPPFITNDTKKLPVISDNVVPEKLIHPDPVESVASASVLKSQLLENDKSFSESKVEGKSNPPTLSQKESKPVPTAISNGRDHIETQVSRTSSTSYVDISEHSDLIDLTSNVDRVKGDSGHNFGSGAKGAEPPPISDITLARESTRLHEDLKQRLAQFPSPRWLQSSDCKLFHSLSFNGLPNANKKLDAELSCSESADGSIASEVEGEVSVDRLRKQIEMDRKSLSVLYKDLEEERNASAIAANQAMAMINKLQEEKAAMQLEVMQYLRMMEQQTEYEQDALRNLNEQLAEREKEIQDLEAKLESFRKSSRDESMAEKIFQPLFDSDESEYSTTSTPHVVLAGRTNKHRLPSMMFQDSAWFASSPIQENLMDFEDEREYISESLKRLERNVRLFSSADASRHDEEDDVFSDETNGGDPEVVNLELQGCAENGRTNPMKEMISSEKHPFPDLKSLSLEPNCISPTLEVDCPVRDHEKFYRLDSSCINKIKSKTAKRENGTTLSNEIDHLNARLEALEADRDFLERSINSLKNGKDGVQFVQEIAAHLRELRKIGLTQREGRAYLVETSCID